MGVGSGGGGTVVNLHHTTNVKIEGNVTAEDDLTLKLTRLINQGNLDAYQQLKRSLGVS